MQDESGDPARRSWLGWLGLVGLLLLAFQAARAALVAAEGERRPAIAGTFWPSHPQPRLTLALAAIGTAASKGQAPPSSALALVRSAGRDDPLGFQPLLVAATEKLAAGDGRAAEPLLKAALRREPRSTAAHFLLADLYIRQERIGEALVHVGVLGRRLRGSGTAGFAGAMASYLRQPGAVAKVAPVLATDLSLRAAVMNGLAVDPSAAAILRQLVRRGDADENWFRIAFERQLAAGDLAGARGLLAGVGVKGGGAELTAWSATSDAGPLAWRFPSGPEGVAEPDRGGVLRLVYYGRADSLLAEHLLLLPPGHYSLKPQFAETGPAGTFEWRLTCLQGDKPLAAWPVNAPVANLAFDMPVDCPAQRLALWGRMGEFPRTTSATLVRVGLSRAEGSL